MFKNVASQKLTLLAIDTTTSKPKTGDAANITAYLSQDDGSVTALTDTSATEMDATNAKGLYVFDLTQAETNADKIVFSAKSSTSDIEIVPLLIYTVPPSFSSSALATASALATVDGIVDDILVDTAEIGAAGAGLSAVPWNAAWDAEVQSEVDDALVAQNLDHLVKIAVDTDFATTVHVDSVVGQLAQTSDGGFSRASDSLEAVRDRGDAAWITATGFSTLDAAGIRTAVGLASANLDTQLAAIDDYLDTELAALITTVGVAGAGLSAIPKTGYILASTGLDSISTTLAAGVPSTFREKQLWLAQRFLGKSIYDTGLGTLIVKAADNTTTMTTQAMTDSAGVQTQGQVT